MDVLNYCGGNFAEFHFVFIRLDLVSSSLRILFYRELNFRSRSFCSSRLFQPWLPVDSLGLLRCSFVGYREMRRSRRSCTGPRLWSLHDGGHWLPCLSTLQVLCNLLFHCCCLICSMKVFQWNFVCPPHLRWLFSEDRLEHSCRSWKLVVRSVRLEWLQ